MLQKVSLWSKSICVTCKLLISVYLDLKSLYPHLKVNWNVLMCKICTARRLVVNIFPWCNANFVPFPSRTLVAHRIGSGRITFAWSWLALFYLVLSVVSTETSSVWCVFCSGNIWLRRIPGQLHHCHWWSRPGIRLNQMWHQAAVRMS